MQNLLTFQQEVRGSCKHLDVAFQNISRIIYIK